MEAVRTGLCTLQKIFQPRSVHMDRHRNASFPSPNPTDGARTYTAVVLTILALLALGLVSAFLGGASPPEDFQTSLVVGDDLDGSSGFEIAPDGRIFILSAPGRSRW